MDTIKRTLSEQGPKLASCLQREVGFSHEEARNFVERAGAALLASYHWQEPELAGSEITSPRVVSDLLAGISGRCVAESVGLSQARAWEGLRALVPAVARSTTALRLSAAHAEPPPS